MPLSTLRLSNFRSYENEEFVFDKNMTAIIGPNGSGKTNIIEALYTLSMTKGFRDNPAAMARSGDTWFRIDAEVDDHSLALTWKDGVKKIIKDGSELSPHEHLGNFPVVLFEPSSLDMVKGAPALRRMWIDRVLSFTDKQYLRALLQYRKALRQRNMLLRKQNTSGDELFAWDMILSEHADYLVNARLKMIESIKNDFTKHYSQIAGGKDTLSLTYRMQLNKEEYRSELLNQLQQRITRDQRMGGTSIGPHRDDIIFNYNEHSLAQFGSRGENRSAVLALVLCELEYLAKKTPHPPLLLLDDVLSELDGARQKALLGAVSKYQTVLTGTEIDQDIGKHSVVELP